MPGAKLIIYYALLVSKHPQAGKEQQQHIYLALLAAGRSKGNFVLHQIALQLMQCQVGIKMPLYLA